MWLAFMSVHSVHDETLVCSVRKLQHCDAWMCRSVSVLPSRKQSFFPGSLLFSVTVLSRESSYALTAVSWVCLCWVPHNCWGGGDLGCPAGRAPAGWPLASGWVGLWWGSSPPFVVLPRGDLLKALWWQNQFVTGLSCTSCFRLAGRPAGRSEQSVITASLRRDGRCAALGPGLLPLLVFSRG